MIIACPHCGSELPDGLNNGIAYCGHCSRIFDSSFVNKLLSAGWALRKGRCHGVEQLMSDTKLQEFEAILVHAYVDEHGYSHDEFLAALRGLGLCL